MQREPRPGLPVHEGHLAALNNSISNTPPARPGRGSRCTAVSSYLHKGRERADGAWPQGTGSETKSLEGRRKLERNARWAKAEAAPAACAPSGLASYSATSSPWPEGPRGHTARHFGAALASEPAHANPVPFFRDSGCDRGAVPHPAPRWAGSARGLHFPARPAWRRRAAGGGRGRHYSGPSSGAGEHCCWRGRGRAVWGQHPFLPPSLRAAGRDQCLLLKGGSPLEAGGRSWDRERRAQAHRSTPARCRWLPAAPDPAAVGAAGHGGHGVGARDALRGSREGDPEPAPERWVAPPPGTACSARRRARLGEGRALRGGRWVSAARPRALSTRQRPQVRGDERKFGPCLALFLLAPLEGGRHCKKTCFVF